MPGIIAGRSRSRRSAPPRYPETLDRARRRALGSYYTPAKIVEHVVRMALGPLLPAAPREALAGRSGGPACLRVLDPAMGDGAFLEAARDLIAESLAESKTMQPAETVLRAGRCLTGVDIDPAAVTLATERLATHGSDGEGPRLLLADTLASVACGGAGGVEATGGLFDAVIGNPPWGGWDRLLGPEEKKRLRARFATARGRIDPFALFIERATSLLADGGRLGLVLPDYFLLKNYPAVRRHVLDNYDIEEIIHWGRVFAGVNLDACTLVARKTPPRGETKQMVRCFPDGPEGRSVMIPQARFAATPPHAFNLALDDRRAALLDRLEAECVRLGEWLETHEGIHSGNIRERLFLPAGAADGDGDPRLVRPLILGRGEIRPFLLRWSGWRVRYDRSAIRRDRGEYANLGDERWFAAAKLLVRRTGDRLVAAHDSTGLFASNNLFVALPRPSCPVPLEYLEGFLNSTLATWCFRTIQPRVGRIFAELKLVHLNRLPVPPPSDDGDIARVVRLVGLLRKSGVAGAQVALRELDHVFAGLARLTAAESRLVSQAAQERRFPRRPSPL
jgi:hypothetical protein